MRFYRISMISVQEANGGEHTGYEYATSKRAAARIVADYRATHRCKVSVINVKPTRTGILHALNVYGGHADNG